MFVRVLSLVLLVGSSLGFADTYTQRCMSGHDMRDMLDRVSGDTLSLHPAKSVRISLMPTADSTELKFEFFLEEECVAPYLTNLVKYKDVLVGGQLVYHLYVGHVITCQSDIGREEWAHWGDYWANSPLHSWDGNVFTEDLSSQPEDAHRVRVSAKLSGNGFSKVRVNNFGGLIPVWNDVENEGFVKTP